MRYHGNADVLSRAPDRDGYALWQDLWASTPEPQRTARRLFLQPFSVEYPLKTSTIADRVRETYNGERDIVRLDIEGGPPGSSFARDHTTVAFLRALLDPGEDPEAARPVAERAHQEAGVSDDEALAWRYYTWWHDNATVDVLAVRSAAVYRQPELRTDEEFVIDAPGHLLTLDFPADADYGFARLRYDPAAIDKKWQERWERDGIYRVDNDDPRPKWFEMTMYPYPSGDLHIGHWYAMAPADCHARFRRMQGYNVLHPIGFDAFGLPAENAAISQGIHPYTWTMGNIDNMRQQLRSLGAIYDWDREIVCC
ncbi:MAG: class I tRNA ligase family protein, partial [Bacteroidetes bacterium]|nr:class I tRNA ligase family protein [Bacteroidota bacterium]